ENHLQVDNVRRDIDTAIAGRHPGEAEDTVGPDLRHCLERHRAVAGGVEDEVDLTELLPDSQHRMVVDILISGAQALDDATLKAVRWRLGIDVHLEPASAPTASAPGSSRPGGWHSPRCSAARARRPLDPALRVSAEEAGTYRSRRPGNSGSRRDGGPSRRPGRLG